MHLDGVRAHEPEVVTDEERESAVVVPLLHRDCGPHLLFTKRADHLTNHPGQMSFPGGKREPEDEDLQATAMREANEEVCLRADEMTFVGRLDDIRTVSNFSVRPFVTKVPDREYGPCEDEVAEVAVISIADLMDPDNHHSEQRDHPYYGEIQLHYFYVDGYTIWGATARILVQFFELATEWTIPPEVDEVVESDADFPV